MNRIRTPFLALLSVTLLLLILLHSTSATTLCPATGIIKPAPIQCLPPTGACYWFRACLYSIGLCGDLGFAVKFADTFCQTSVDQKGLFLAKGQAFLNAVNVCLQQASASLIPMCNTTQCSQVQTLSLSAHPKCYVLPDPNTPNLSLCQLSCNDLTALATVVNLSSYVWPTPTNAFKEMVGIYLSCPNVTCSMWGWKAPVIQSG